MKKIILTLAVMLCAASASAQNWVNSVSTASNWAAGLRIGSGLEVQAQYTFSSENYIEGRFGMQWLNPGAVVCADLTMLFNWNLLTMNWTPKAGTWFFDAGCGFSVGGREHYAYVGPAGNARFGIELNKVPLRIGIDWTPMFGPEIAYYKGWSTSQFYSYGLANFGISCVYRF